jgi:hypothetical protein
VVFAKAFSIFILLSLGFASNALAQAAPGNNIDDRVRQQSRILSEREREEAMMTGDTDILLTRRTKLFNLHGLFGADNTSNAFLTPFDARTDVFGQAQIGLSFGTKIANKIDVFADLSANTVHYSKYAELDYSALTGVIGARTDIGPVSLNATYQPAVVFDREFRKRQLTSHRTRISAALPFNIKKLNIEPSISIERTLSNPTDYRAWSGGAGVTFSAPISRKIPLFAFASVNYEKRDFDSYFPDLVGVRRIDDNWSGGVGLVWQLRNGGEVRASYNYGRNSSTSDVNIYRAKTGTIGISAAFRF